MAYKKEKVKKYLEKIESFLYHKYDTEVLYLQNDKDAFYQSLDRVEINSRQNYNSRLHSLLHEAGHVVLRSGGRSGERVFKNRFSSMNCVDREHRGNLAHRVDVLREEVLAWEEGEKLAFDLNITLDKELWSRHRGAALASYIKWVKK